MLHEDSKTGLISGVVDVVWLGLTFEGLVDGLVGLVVGLVGMVVGLAGTVGFGFGLVVGCSYS